MDKSFAHKLAILLIGLILQSGSFAISSNGNPAPILKSPAPLPSHPGYLRLKEALAGYRNIADKGGWPKIPAGPNMKKDQEGERIRLVRQRLRISEEMDARKIDDVDFFDSDLEEAVRGFQRRHGLKPDGIVGPATLAAMNVSVEERIHQIEANLERWQWLPRDLGERYILINIPAYELEVIESGRPAIEMRLIVGKQYWSTPVFSAIMTHVVFRPYWNVPPRMAKTEVLPRILQDPSYLVEQGIRILEGWDNGTSEIAVNGIDWTKIDAAHFQYRFRQDPGPKNPLGRIKFIFPNRFNVYLHDTPSGDLFKKRRRAFSHGCIRVEKPVELAEYALRGNPAWTKERILSEMEGSYNRTVRLPVGIPVYILYWTAWVEEDGTVQFREDVYGHDERLDKTLEAKEPTH